jgi:hypothetical protein
MVKNGDFFFPDIDLNSPLLGPFLPVLENALVLRGQLLVFPFIEDCGSLLLHQFKIPIQLFYLTGHGISW